MPVNSGLYEPGARSGEPKACRLNRPVSLRQVRFTVVGISLMMQASHTASTQACNVDRRELVIIVLGLLKLARTLLMSWESVLE
jgi:hypothetical protein